MRVQIAEMIEMNGTLSKKRRIKAILQQSPSAALTSKMNELQHAPRWVKPLDGVSACHSTSTMQPRGRNPMNVRGSESVESVEVFHGPFANVEMWSLVVAK
jgi:hypothetical protein